MVKLGSNILNKAVVMIVVDQSILIDGALLIHRLNKLPGSRNQISKVMENDKKKYLPLAANYYIYLYTQNNFPSGGLIKYF